MAKRRSTFVLAPFVVAAGCGGILGDSTDGGGADGGPLPGTCTTSADCPNGGDCAYPDTGGCGAHKQCFPPKQQCKGQLVCACDGTSLGDDCNGAAPKPVAHSGVCQPDCTTEPACEVCDVTAYTPATVAPPEDATQACSPSDVQAFVAACVSATATQTTCAAWEQTDAGGSCGACIFTQVTAAKSGPLVCDSSGCVADTGGCVDIVLSEVPQETASGGPGSCGDLVNAEYGCIDFACAACVSSSDLNACDTSAKSNECKTYADAVAGSPECATDANTSVCLPQSDQDWASFIDVFCGAGP